MTTRRTPDARLQRHDSVLASVVSAPTPKRREAIDTVLARIVNILGSQFDVQMHGSWATGTTTSDATRLDLVAVRVADEQAPQNFGELYFQIATMLERTEYRQRVIERTSDLWLSGAVEAIVTPALGHSAPGSDRAVEPLFVRPVNTMFRRLLPQLHVQRVRALNERVDGRFVEVTRLLKQWNRAYGLDRLSTGFYLESIVYGAPIEVLQSGLTEALVGTIDFALGLDPATDILTTPAGDMDAFLDVEWAPERFVAWQKELAALSKGIERVVAAASDERQARAAWRDVLLNVR